MRRVCVCVRCLSVFVCVYVSAVDGWRMQSRTLFALPRAPDVANMGDDSVRVIRSDARPRLPPHIGRRCETIREHAQWKDSAHGFDEARE